MIDPKDASYIEHLESEIEKLRTQVKERDDQIERLRKEKGLSSAREGLTFNQRTGLWAAESGQHFCPRCLDQEKRNPVATEDRGWRCSVCRFHYSDPDRPPPVVRTRGPRSGRI